MNNELELARSIVNSHLALYIAEQENIDRIVQLVQQNQEFFIAARIGGSCLAAAATKLEQDVKAWRAMREQGYR